MTPSSRSLSVLTSLALVLFLLTGAIAVPILYRPFYYAQIDSLSLVTRTGFSPQVIREAFDEVMDYLVLGRPFGTGTLRWSESGKAHFTDCRVLFRLDFVVLAVTAVFLLVVILLTRARAFRLYRFWGKGPCFWALVGMAAFLLIFGVWALVDFNSLFTAFHTVLFPGRTNWNFDWRADEIILILPEEFWARTAALVGILAFGGAILPAAFEGILRRGREPKNVYEELRNWKDE